MKMSVDRLLSLGHRRIALISASTGTSGSLNFSEQRRAGYLDGLADAGIAVDPNYIVDDIYDHRSGYSAMMQLLALERRPTAVIVDNNLGGIGVMRALLDAGMVAGRDLSVIIYDGLPPYALVGTTVTSVIQPAPDKVGQQLAEMMLALLAGEDPSRLQVLWQPQIKVGDSDDPCPA